MMIRQSIMPSTRFDLTPFRLDSSVQQGAQQLRAELTQSVRGASIGDTKTEYVKPTLNAFTVQASNGRSASVTGIEGLGDSVRLHYSVDGQSQSAVLSGGLGRALGMRDMLMGSLGNLFGFYARDGVLSKDEQNSLKGLMGAVRGLQEHLMRGIDSQLGLSKRLAGEGTGVATTMAIPEGGTKPDAPIIKPAPEQPPVMTTMAIPEGGTKPDAPVVATLVFEGGIKPQPEPIKPDKPVVIATLVAEGGQTPVVDPSLTKAVVEAGQTPDITTKALPEGGTTPQINNPILVAEPIKQPVVATLVFEGGIKPQPDPIKPDKPVVMGTMAIPEGGTKPEIGTPVMTTMAIPEGGTKPEIGTPIKPDKPVVVATLVFEGGTKPQTDPIKPDKPVVIATLVAEGGQTPVVDPSLTKAVVEAGQTPDITTKALPEGGTKPEIDNPILVAEPIKQPVIATLVFEGGTKPQTDPIKPDKPVVVATLVFEGGTKPQTDPIKPDKPVVIATLVAEGGQTPVVDPSLTKAALEAGQTPDITTKALPEGGQTPDIFATKALPEGGQTPDIKTVTVEPIFVRQPPEVTMTTMAIPEGGQKPEFETA